MSLGTPRLTNKWYRSIGRWRQQLQQRRRFCDFNCFTIRAICRFEYFATCCRQYFSSDDIRAEQGGIIFVGPCVRRSHFDVAICPISHAKWSGVVLQSTCKTVLHPGFTYVCKPCGRASLRMHKLLKSEWQNECIICGKVLFKYKWFPLEFPFSGKFRQLMITFPDKNEITPTVIADISYAITATTTGRSSTTKSILDTFSGCKRPFFCKSYAVNCFFYSSCKMMKQIVARRIF